ncbi:hypothetical protein GUY61_05310 [Streptomyces sp. GC420]|nr:hypothetical protein [Streptomyces sp. GC420]
MLESAYIRGKAEGRAETRAATEGRDATLCEVRAEAVLIALEQRRAVLTPGVRNRIASCADPATLDAWLNRVHEIDAPEELFHQPIGSLPDRPR